MKHTHRQPLAQGFYLRTTKKDVFLGEDLEEAKDVFHTNSTSAWAIASTGLSIVMHLG